MDKGSSPHKEAADNRAMGFDDIIRVTNIPVRQDDTGKKRVIIKGDNRILVKYAGPDILKPAGPDTTDECLQIRIFIWRILFHAYLRYIWSGLFPYNYIGSDMHKGFLRKTAAYPPARALSRKAR
jgi:hypothetical protein